MCLLFVFFFVNARFLLLSFSFLCRRVSHIPSSVLTLRISSAAQSCSHIVEFLTLRIYYVSRIPSSVNFSQVTVDFSTQRQLIRQRRLTEPNFSVLSKHGFLNTCSFASSASRNAPLQRRSSKFSQPYDNLHKQQSVTSFEKTSARIVRKKLLFANHFTCSVNFRSPIDHTLKLARI